MITDRVEFERWMKQAKRTLESAVRDKDAGDFNWSCFKAQQAAEYTLKGLLYGMGVSAVGHSLVGLLGELKRKGLEVQEVQAPARTLDRHYIPTRYANAHVEGAPFEFYDESTANEALGCAKRIIEFVKKVSAGV
jgi:HEPN domain-containing protein